MEKQRKLLKELSIVILVFAALSLVRMIVDVAVHGFVVTEIIEGMSPEMLRAFAIVAWVLGLLFLWPEVYVGYKGIKVANNPDDSKRHITIAKILLVLLVISLISAIIEITKSTDLVHSIITIADMVLDICIYFLYIKYAKEIRNQSKQ